MSTRKTDGHVPVLGLLLALGLLVATPGLPVAAAEGSAGSPAPLDLVVERRPEHVGLSWDHPSQAEPAERATYQVERRTVGSQTWTTLGISHNTSYRDAGAEPPPATYEYRVTALGSNGSGPTSAAVPVEESWPFVRIEHPDDGDVLACSPAEAACSGPAADPGTGDLACAAEDHEVDASTPCRAALATGETEVQVYAYSPRGIEEVRFSLDGQLRQVANQPGPDGRYAWTWDTGEVPSGVYEVSAEALDRQGSLAETQQAVATFRSHGNDPPSHRETVRLDGQQVTAQGSGPVSVGDGLVQAPTTEPAPSSEGCAASRVEITLLFVEERRGGGACAPEALWSGSVKLVVHGASLGVRGDDAHLGRLLASPTRLVHFGPAPGTSMCVGASVEVPEVGDLPGRVGTTSCDLRPHTNGTYRVSVLQDGWWLHVTLEVRPPRSVPTEDPFGGEAQRSIVNPRIHTEEDPAFEGCFGIRVTTPGLGSHEAIAGFDQQVGPYGDCQQETVPP